MRNPAIFLAVGVWVLPVVFLACGGKDDVVDSDPLSCEIDAAGNAAQSDLQYVDEITMQKSLENRVPV